MVRAQAGDTTLSFRALRLSYAATPGYSPYGTSDSDLRKQAYAALDATRLSEATGLIDSLLAGTFVDIEGHAAAGYLAEQRGDSARATFHRWITSGLLSSIDESGSGTKASPFLVISVAEEYAWAALRGFRRKGLQGLGECGGRVCDWVQFVDRRTDVDTTFYFDVSIPMTWMDRQFKR